MTEDETFADGIHYDKPFLKWFRDANGVRRPIHSTGMGMNIEMMEKWHLWIGEGKVRCSLCGTTLEFGKDASNRMDLPYTIDTCFAVLKEALHRVEPATRLKDTNDESLSRRVDAHPRIDRTNPARSGQDREGCPDSS